MRERETVPFKEEVYNSKGEVIDTLPFKFEVNLDELETCYNARIQVKPVDPHVVIASYYYEKDENEINPHDFKRICEFTGNYFYNDEDDEIIVSIHNGFDVAVFNMCSLLGIGRVSLDETVPVQENGFAPVHDKVMSIKLTLEEFKQLDGFVAVFKFTPHFILFKGLLIGANYIHSDVDEGDVVPDFRSEKLLRGENLFKWD